MDYSTDTIAPTRRFENADEAIRHAERIHKVAKLRHEAATVVQLRAAALMLAASPSFSANATVTDTCFPSTDAAAISALRAALPLSETTERAGAVVRDGSCYRITTLIEGERDRFAMNLVKPRSAKLAAIFHTHPPAEHDERFSPEDVQAAAALRVPSYIGIVRDGSIRRLDDAKVLRFSRSAMGHQTPGVAGVLVSGGAK